jgi:hypothetical protein
MQRLPPDQVHTLPTDSLPAAEARRRVDREMQEEDPSALGVNGLAGERLYANPHRVSVPRRRCAADYRKAGLLPRQ